MSLLAVDLSFLPAVNASLNGVATVLLVIGLVLIKQKKTKAHRNVMISAFAVSVLFLMFYLLHKSWKASQGMEVNTPFNAEGAMKLVYLLILFTHLILAMVVPVLAIAMLVLAFKKRFALHRKLGKITWPVWMYVSVTGVVIYFMLYHFNPSGPGG